MRAKQMLATMSHEIRSPLSGVVSMVEILSTIKLDKDQKQLLSVMLSSGDLVLQLINGILDLSKVKSGVPKLEATKYDVPVEVMGDVIRIRQIYTNLISNAIKFTHQGKVDNDENSVLQNGVISEIEPHSHEILVWIRCDVKDTWIGIPETTLPNLFKKYMQAAADTQWKYGGTGLGLAICKQLVELMGGHLTVSSIEHCGSTFTFTLPYKVLHACDSSDDTNELWLFSIPATHFRLFVYFTTLTKTRLVF
ncbi:histidine kinase 5-like protein [Tanacetum coccineum]